jgi:MFS family permease
VIIFTQIAQMLLAFILAFLTFNGTVQVWHVVVLSFLLGLTNAVDAPARQALIADIVPREDLSSGISLSSTIYNASRVFGPTAAGVALVQFGPAWCFLINGLTFLAVLAGLMAMKVETQIREVGSFAPFLQLKEGLNFSAKHPTIAPLLLLASVGAVFSFNITTLFPAFADTSLHSPKEGFAALSTANGLGAVFAAVFVTAISNRFGRGRVIAAMAISGPIMTFLLATSSTLIVALVMAALAGFCVILQFVSMNTLIQREVPDGFRARVMSLYTLTFFGIAPFAAVGLGAFAQQTNTANAVALCGIAALILNTFILIRAPKLRNTV